MKRFTFLATVLLFVSIAFVSSVFAQDTPKVINGGVLNGKATSLPVPAYPDAARADNAGGRVSVNVTVDEDGNVIEARALPEFTTAGNSDGEGAVTTPVHPALQEAAEKAAWTAKFSPTKLSGQPVRIKGTILYNFVAGEAERLYKGPENGDESNASPPAEINSVPSAISGGVLNSKASYLPAPAYPPAARAVRAGGSVAVQVLVDENGMVISATAASGHPLLRAAATEAAKKAQFSPTLLSGKAVKVAGILTYNFVP